MTQPHRQNQSKGKQLKMDVIDGLEQKHVANGKEHTRAEEQGLVVLVSG